MRDDADDSIRTSSDSSGANTSPTRKSKAAMAVRTSSETSAHSDGNIISALAISGVTAES